MNDSCPFCDENLKKQRMLWEDELTITFLSDPRLMPGHTLVVPKRHIEKPWELTQDELVTIFKNLWKVEQRIIKSGLGTGCDVRQNYRPFMTQSRVKVDHVHFHAMPRTLSDELFQTSMQFEDFQDLEDDERQEVEKLLRT